VFGFFAVWLRRWLSETPVFEAMHARKELASGLPLRRVFERHLPSVLLSMLVTWMLTAAIVVLILMTPTLVQSAFHSRAGARVPRQQRGLVRAGAGLPVFRLVG
jgi:hypothetical protein